MRYLLALTLLVALSFGVNYHVAKTGSNSNTGLDSVNAYLTIGKLASVFAAGDTGWCYNGRFDETLTFYNAGTAAAPIVLRSKNPRACTLAGFLYIGQKHFRFERFTQLDGIRIENTADTCVVCSCEIRPIELHGASRQVGIYTGWSTGPNDFNHGSLFQYNVVHGFGTGGTGDGHYTHHARQLRILHDTVYDCERNNMQIYHTNDSVEVAYCVSYNAIHSTGILYDGKRGNIHHNICYNNPQGIRLQMEAAEGGHNKVWNNVCYNNGTNFSLADSGFDSVYNNLFISPTNREMSLEGAAYNRSWFNYNLYGINDSFAGYANYAAWKAAWGQNANSINVDPTVVDTSALNFRLLTGSPAIDAGWPLTATGYDFDGNAVPSPAAGAFDIGAFEYQQVPDSLDAGVVSIVGPLGRIDTGTVVIPQAWVKNHATNTVSFDVWLTIAPAYADTQTVTSLAEGDSVEVSFANWTAGPSGSRAVRCSTYLAGDQNAANDRRTGSVLVNPSSAHAVPMGRIWKFGAAGRRVIAVRKAP